METLPKGIGSSGSAYGSCASSGCGTFTPPPAELTAKEANVHTGANGGFTLSAGKHQYMNEGATKERRAWLTQRALRSA